MNAIPMPEGNLFMACWRVERAALRPPPPGFELRSIRPDELDMWKDMQADSPGDRGYMDEYFERVYAPQAGEFFRRCRVACMEGTPVGACMLWRAYGCVNTLHWLKVRPEFEGRGLGRALLSDALGALELDDMPVCLHTQPASYRAIKLYSDMGFCLLTDPAIGGRTNDLERALPELERVMPGHVYDSLKFARAPIELIEAAARARFCEF